MINWTSLIFSYIRAANLLGNTTKVCQWLQQKKNASNLLAGGRSWIVTRSHGRPVALENTPQRFLLVSAQGDRVILC